MVGLFERCRTSFSSQLDPCSQLFPWWCRKDAHHAIFHFKSSSSMHWAQGGPHRLLASMDDARSHPLGTAEKRARLMAWEVAGQLPSTFHAAVTTTTIWGISTNASFLAGCQCSCWMGAILKKWQLHRVQALPQPGLLLIVNLIIHCLLMTLNVCVPMLSRCSGCKYRHCHPPAF